MMFQQYDTMDEAYLSTVKKVWRDPDQTTSPRGMLIKEKVDYGFEVRLPTHTAFRTGWEERDRKMALYLRKEMALYRSGENRASVWGAEASNFWNGIANPDGTVNSNYGRLIFQNFSHGNETMEDLSWKNRGLNKTEWSGVKRTPWQWALLSLLNDKDSRQAFVRVSLPEHQWWGNADQVCTMHLHFRVRPPRRGSVDQLDLTVVMRSNDVIRGLPYDAPFFAWCQYRMVNDLAGGELLPSGERRALQVEIGHYRHFAHSMHAYVNDEATVRRLIKEADARGL